MPYLVLVPIAADDVSDRMAGHANLVRPQRVRASGLPVYAGRARARIESKAECEVASFANRTGPIAKASSRNQGRALSLVNG